MLNSVKRNTYHIASLRLVLSGAWQNECLKPINCHSDNKSSIDRYKERLSSLRLRLLRHRTDDLSMHVCMKQPWMRDEPVCESHWRCSWASKSGLIWAAVVRTSSMHMCRHLLLLWLHVWRTTDRHRLSVSNCWHRSVTTVHWFFSLKMSQSSQNQLYMTVLLKYSCMHS